MSLLAVAIWSGHNHKVSTSILGAVGPIAPDRSRVGVLVDAEVVVSEIGGRAVLVLVVTANLLGLVEDATGSGASTTTAGSSHSRD